jgi:hypothetical protein
MMRHDPMRAFAGTLTLERGLGAEEERLARRVFQDTIPLSRIRLTPALRHSPLALGAYQSCTLAVGPAGFFRGMHAGDLRGALVHELTHVWQALHVDDALLDTAWHRLHDGEGARSYAENAAWESYDAERQAEIVEDWCAAGAVENDTHPLYPYIRDAIRRPKERRRTVVPFAPFHG